MGDTVVHAALSAVLTGVLVAGATGSAAQRDMPRLRVSADGRCLVTPEGDAFFWLGDTAWSLRVTSPEDADAYMQSRAANGFNVIQVHCGYEATDFAGARPFEGDDADTPNEAFWRNIDLLVGKSRDHGLYIALVPMWGVEYGKAFGGDAAKARRFGEWIGRRYAGKSNVMWIVSGEYDSINGFRLPITDAQKGVLNAFAGGLREGSGGLQLMTIHPGAARTSSLDFHDAPWLDFDMLQSGHTIDCEAYGMAENHALIAHDRGLAPTKPVLDGEPIYEDTPDGVWMGNGADGPRADAAAVRRKAYWAVLSGAFGHTYGHNDVYCFYEPEQPGLVRAELPAQRGSWRDALDAPGALQMKHMRSLCESRPFLGRVPDPSLVAGDPTTGLDHVEALRGEDGAYAMIYIPTGKPVIVALGRLQVDRVVAWWYDPRTGRARRVGLYDADGKREFTPPTSGDGQDWVLVLDDAARDFAPPGRSERRPEDDAT